MKWNDGKPCGVEPDARRRVASSTLLSATPTALLRDMQTLGRLFESLVIRDLRVFVSTFRAWDTTCPIIVTTRVSRLTP